MEAALMELSLVRKANFEQGSTQVRSAQGDAQVPWVHKA